MEPVGRRIKELRQERGLTQPELAHLSGVGLSTISTTELAKNRPNKSTLYALAHGLGVEPQVLTGKTV